MTHESRGGAVERTAQHSLSEWRQAITQTTKQRWSWHNLKLPSILSIYENTQMKVCIFCTVQVGGVLSAPRTCSELIPGYNWQQTSWQSHDICTIYSHFSLWILVLFNLRKNAKPMNVWYQVSHTFRLERCSIASHSLTDGGQPSKTIRAR